MSGPLRVVIFAAKSTTDEKGSIPQQVEECQRHAAAQGWTVDAVERDEAASAWTGNRGPGLERAMARAEALAKAHGRAGLLVWKSNRLARGELVNAADARHLIDYFRWADRVGVELHSVTDPATFTNSLVAFVVGEMNAAESKAKSDAVRRAMNAKRKAGVHVWGDVYGYKRDPDAGLVPDPETAPVVARIFSMVASGASQVEVMQALSADGIPSPRGGRSGWSQGSISAMLRRRTYIGEIPTDDPRERADRNVPEAWGPGAHEAIVARDVFDAAQAANARRAKRKGKGGGRPSKAGHLLSGRMLHHGACGRAMVPRTYESRKDGTVKGVYECSGRKGGVCDGLSVPMDAVDGAITGYLAEVGVDAEATLRLLNDSNRARRETATRALADARRDLTRLEDERARLWAGFRAGDVDPDDWRAFKAEHGDEKAATEAKIAQLEARAAEDDAAPVVVPAVADAMALVREFIARGDRNAVRNVMESLFSDFIIGKADDLPPEAGPDVTPEDARAARAAVRERIAAMEAEAGRTAAEGNAEAMAEALDLPFPEPAPDPLNEGLTTDGLIILPEPRLDALASVSDPSGATFLVDEHGRSLFRRLPLQTTNTDALTT